MKIKLLHNENIMTLADAQIGDVVEISGYQFSMSSSIRAKLLALGLIRKTKIEVMNISAFGDLVEIKVRGYNLSLRKEEARCIKVKKDVKVT